MKIVSILKDDKLYYGTIPAISSEIGCNPYTIRRWIKQGKKELNKKGYTIFLDTIHLRKKVNISPTE